MQPWTNTKRKRTMDKLREREKRETKRNPCYKTIGFYVCQKEREKKILEM